MKHAIETVSGKLIDVLDPNPDDILIDDIAWSLSRMTRYVGHTITLIPYTVGQHSVFVSRLSKQSYATKIVQMYCLLHDAAEYLVTDLASPVKSIPGIREAFEPIEQKLLDTIFMKYVGKLPTELEWAAVKFYDKKAQFIEAHNFMVSRGRHWEGREKYDICLLELQDFPIPIQSTEVYKQFLTEFEELNA